jgi:hypothetical protein
MKRLIFLCLLVLLAAACAPPAGQRYYTGTIHCERSGLYVDYITVTAENEAEASSKIARRMDQSNKYQTKKLQHCYIDKVEAR